MKYFHTYRDDIMKAKEGPQSNDKVDCVICTNIDFDKEIKNPIQQQANKHKIDLDSRS